MFGRVSCWLFLFFLPPSTIPVGMFLVAHFLPSLFVVYQYVSEWEERGKNVENQLVYTCNAL